MAIEKPGARQSLQSDINGHGTQKRQGYGYEGTRAALKRARRDQSEDGLSKSCSAITVNVTFNKGSGIRSLSEKQIKKHENVSQRIRQFDCLLLFQRF